MTEAEWNACTDPQPMLEFLRGKVGDRKLRLFACACCRFIPGFLESPPDRRALEWTEKDVDEPLDETLFVMWTKWDIRWDRRDAWGAVWRAIESYLTEVDILEEKLATEELAEAYKPAQANMTGLVRELFGNPLRPVTIDRFWLTPTVASLAQAIYTDHAFDRMPILADALEDAGCTNADILSHCRGPGSHVLGCWVVDLLLGKE